MPVDKKGKVSGYSMKAKETVQMYNVTINVIVNGKRVTFQASGFDGPKKDANAMSALVSRDGALLAIDKGEAKKGKGWDLVKKDGTLK
jgi:hypothetical protein